MGKTIKIRGSARSSGLAQTRKSKRYLLQELVRLAREKKRL
ncbi:MAG TPA: hypothetical protein VFD08_03005 [Clostridia bacterium]|nr:hypothetical protein [Clostridia bacterium]